MNGARVARPQVLAWLHAMSSMLVDPVVAFATVSLILAAWMPLSWAWSFMEPGSPPPAGIDGPVSWFSRWWTRADSPVLFQPLVPLACTWIAWHQRKGIGLAMARWQADNPDVKPSKRLPLLLLMGLLAMVASHLSHVPTVAVFGLQCMACGLVQLAVHRRIMAFAWRPFAFLATMSMPPETVLGLLRDGTGLWFARGVATVGGRLGLGWTADGWHVHAGIHSLDMGPSRCVPGAAIAAASMVLAVGLARHRRLELLPMSAAGALASVVVLEALRCIAAIAVFSSSPERTGSALVGTAWVWCAPSILIWSRWMDTRLRRAYPDPTVHPEQHGPGSTGPHRDGIARARERHGRGLRAWNHAIETAADWIGHVLAWPFRTLLRTAQGLEDAMGKRSRRRRDKEDNP